MNTVLPARIPCLGNSSSWVCQNALSQSVFRILKTALSQIRFNESTWFIECRYRFKKVKDGL